LEQQGIISGFQTVSESTSERRYTFQYKGMPKEVIELFNSRENMKNNVHDGDVALNVHPKAQEGLDAVYFWAFPSIEAIKAIQINLLPRLKIGGVFEGSYYNHYSYGAGPHALGLVRESGTYRKERHLESEEIEDRIQFTIDDYIREELHPPWVSDKHKPTVREQAEKRGAHIRKKPTPWRF